MSSVYFNGEMITIPGAYSSIDVSQMGTKRDDSATKLIAIIGEADGGEPETLQLFSDPVSAKKVLKSGELLVACNKAWNPVTSSKAGVAVGGANVIAAIRTNRATKGSVDINDGQLVIESQDWNADVNQIAVKMADGTNGSKTMVVYDQKNDVYETFSNIGGLFSLKYTGDQDYAAVSITKDKDTKEVRLITKIGADASSAVEDINILLSQMDAEIIKSMRALISILKSYENYSVSVVSNYVSSTKVSEIDPIADVDIKTSAANITSFYANISSKLKVASNLVQVKSYDDSKGAVDAFDYKYLTGGSDGTTLASWVKYFDMLSNYNVTYIVPLTGDAAIQAELFSHVQTQSGTKGKERRMIVGGEIGETVADTIARANSFANARAQVVHGGFYDYDDDGELVLYAPYMLAAQHAGRCANLDDGESATHDVYKMAMPEYKLSTSEVTQLIEAGCLAFEFVLDSSTISSSFVRLVQDITTDISSTSSVYTERATGVLADSINMEIREKCDEILTGKRTSTSDLTTVKNAVLTILYNRKNVKDQILDYKDVYVSKSGTTTTINYSVAPAEVNNFTLITAHYYSEDLSV